MKQGKRFQMMTRSLALLLAVVLITGCLGVPAFAFELEPESKPKPEHEHNWQLTDTLDPSCTEAGYQVYICTGCGERDTRALDPLGHTPGEAVRENETPATCTADSSYDLVVYCAACEAELNRKTVTEYGTARGHVWDGGVQTVAPSSEAEGVMTYTCLNCGETVTKPIEKLPPMPVKVVFDSGIEGTEIEVYPRPTEDEPKPEPIEPEADETWLLLPGQYEYIAEAESYERVGKTPFTVRTLVEGEKELKIDLSLTPIHVHKYAVTETHEPGCTEQGYTVYTCECGDSYTE